MNFSSNPATYIKKAGKKDPDAAIISAIAEGEKEALRILYEKYNKRIFRFAFRLLHNYEASQDVTSEVFLTIWEKAGSYQGRSRVSTWIFGITHNKIRDIWRKKVKTSELFENEISVEISSKLEARYDFSQAFEKLPHVQQEAIEMVFYLGMTYEEAAKIIGCPEGTIKSRVFNARKNLKVFLQPTRTNVGQI